jgi:hypothetical protein
MVFAHCYYIWHNVVVRNPFIFYLQNNILQVTCSKSCYNAVSSKLSAAARNSDEGTKGVKWHNDGLNTSPLTILLKWLMMEGNYNRDHGASDSILPSDKGKTKDSYCSEICKLIKKSGIKI